MYLDMNSADLLLDARGPEILHRTGITAPDSFIYIYPKGGTPTVFFDAREYDVQKQKIAVLKNGVDVQRLESFSGTTFQETLANILTKFQINAVNISPGMEYRYICMLQEKHIAINVHDYESERDRKTEKELEIMIDAQRVNESAFDLVWNVLNDSVIQEDRILYQGDVLTSELVKSKVRVQLLEQGYGCPDGIIIASGEQTARPHDEGNGPLLPNESIIVDIFPSSETTGFVADMTRTFVKGNPKPEVQALFDTVQSVQKEIANSIQVGEKCSDVHARTVSAFAKLGHPTSPEQGFMHGTGHSLGLSVHEGPRLNSSCDRIIEHGMTLTVEPGLYYPGVGGVRIEDVIVFHPNGTKENITQFDKPLFIV